MKNTFIFCFLFLSTTQAFAQYNSPKNNVWAFGYHAGLDFNGNPSPPLPIITEINTNTDTSVYGEANASVCDDNGNLLFYTNGSRVWDRTNTLMPGNLNCLHGLTDTADVLTTSTRNGAVIVPIPGNPNRYYLFSLTGIGPMATAKVGELYYSIIDMNLHNGFGDIVPGKKWVLTDSLLSEKMVVVAGDCGNIWLVVHARDTNQFKAYEITSAGLNTQPVVSYAGIYRSLPVNIDGTTANFYYTLGQMTAAPNGKRLAAAYATGGCIAVYDFDQATGIVSHEVILDSLTNLWYGTAFSPSSQMVYFSNYGLMTDSNNAKIYQFDLSLSTAQAIRNSKYKVGNNYSSQLRLAPDGKIYFRFNSQYISWIANPDAAGSACNYFPSYVVFSAGSYYINQGFLGFDAPVIKAEIPSSGVFRVHNDTISCLDTNLILTAPGNQLSYLWDNETTNQSRIIHQPGTYWVHSVHDCTFDTDTFKVFYNDAYDLHFSLGSDTVVCNTGKLLLSGPVMEGAHYLWQDSSTNRQFLAKQSGQYALTVNRGNCHAEDTIKVTMVNLFPDLGKDVVFCLNDEIYLVLKVKVQPGVGIRWSDGTAFDKIPVNDTGLYYVTLSELGCTGSDTIKITKRLCDCRIYFPNSFSPNGDGLNDVFLPNRNNCPLKKYRLRIYNRLGQQVFESTNPDIGWNGTFKGAPVALGTYFFYAVYLPEGSVSKEHTVSGDLTLIR